MRGVILLFKDITKKEKIKKQNICYLLVALIIGIVMVFLENKIVAASIDNLNYLYLILSGFLMSIGIVVPGVSSTVILMLLGIYSIYLNSISNLNLSVLIPIAIGIFIGSIVFMKGIKFLLENYYINTMYIIIGFTLGSLWVLIPEIGNILELIIAFLCIIIGYYSIYKFHD